jgi:hypothetical protein
MLACFSHCRPWADRFGCAQAYEKRRIGASNRQPDLSIGAGYGHSVGKFFEYTEIVKLSNKNSVLKRICKVIYEDLTDFST